MWHLAGQRRTKTHRSGATLLLNETSKVRKT
jgi:hypothetical protein